MALNFEHTRQLCRFIILLSTLILYMCICAAIYSLLEKENDRTQYNLYQGLKKSYKRKYNLSEDEFIKFVKDASIIYKRGYMGEYRDYWNFYHSFWFTITVVTTIGKARFHILSSYILIIVLVVGYIWIQIDPPRCRMWGRWAFMLNWFFNLEKGGDFFLFWKLCILLVPLNLQFCRNIG